MKPSSQNKVGFNTKCGTMDEIDLEHWRESKIVGFQWEKFRLTTLLLSIKMLHYIHCYI